MDLARLKGWIAEKQVNPQQLVMRKIERWNASFSEYLSITCKPGGSSDSA